MPLSEDAIAAQKPIPVVVGAVTTIGSEGSTDHSFLLDMNAQHQWSTRSDVREFLERLLLDWKGMKGGEQKVER